MTVGLQTPFFQNIQTYVDQSSTFFDPPRTWFGVSTLSGLTEFAMNTALAVAALPVVFALQLTNLVTWPTPLHKHVAPFADDILHLFEKLLKNIAHAFVTAIPIIGNYIEGQIHTLKNPPKPPQQPDDSSAIKELTAAKSTIEDLQSELINLKSIKDVYENRLKADADAADARLKEAITELTKLRMVADEKAVLVKGSVQEALKETNNDPAVALEKAISIRNLAQDEVERLKRLYDEAQDTFQKALKAAQKELSNFQSLWNAAKVECEELKQKWTVAQAEITGLMTTLKAEKDKAAGKILQLTNDLAEALKGSSLQAIVDSIKTMLDTNFATFSQVLNGKKNKIEKKQVVDFVAAIEQNLRNAIKNTEQQVRTAVERAESAAEKLIKTLTERLQKSEDAREHLTHKVKKLETDIDTIVEDKVSKAVQKKFAEDAKDFVDAKSAADVKPSGYPTAAVSGSTTSQRSSRKTSPRFQKETGPVSPSHHHKTPKKPDAVAVEESSSSVAAAETASTATTTSTQEVKGE